MVRKPVKVRKNYFRINEHRGLISLLAVLLILLFTFYFYSGCDFIPDDMAVIPSWTTATPTPKPTETSPADAPIVASPLLITEIQSSNRSILQTADLISPDWIEFYNAGQTAVSLEDYGLSDNLNRPTDWTFPAVMLQPGDFLIVYASGLTDPDAIAAALEDGEIHASFRLSQTGEDLIFTNPSGQVLARLAIPEIPIDVSWGLLDGAVSSTDPYYFFAEPSPGKANGTEGHLNAADAIVTVTSDLVVNEYLTRQDRMPDSDGDYSDWVEFFNSGTEPVSLLGCYLSDDPDDPELWAFPDLTVEPGDYLVVWLSGKEKVYEPGQSATLHAPFRLGDQNELLLLSDSRGRRLVAQPLQSLPLNVSCGRSLQALQSWLFFPQPTPGRPNDSQGFAEMEGALMLSNRGIWINEVVAMDATVTAGKKTTDPDWIELFNGTDEAVDLTGYGLSDNPDEPFLEMLDGIMIPAGSHAIINPAAFGISPAGETLQLTDPDGIWVDRFETGVLANGISSGRGNTNGQESVDSRFFYIEPTEGQANTTAAMTGITPVPSIEAVTASTGKPVSGLYLEEPLLVSLVAWQPDTVIYYTLDGGMPDQRSVMYTEPLLIDRTTVMRCIAVHSGSLPSSTRVRTFLAEERHDLPVVSIIGNAADFFHATTGLWTNYQADIEHPAEIDFYEADGTSGVQFMVGVNLHGSYSRTEKQKSMELKVRTLYGDSQVTYPFFPGNEVQTFKRFVLRTSGQDWRFTKLRDAFMTEVIKDYTAQDTMDWRTCVVYINGEYFGLYYLREKVDQYYMASHHGADADNVDIIKGNRIILSGDYDAYRALLTYVKNNDMRNPEHYAYVLSQIDEHSLMDFVITQTFFNNLDSGNKKFWRERTDGAEWRWVFFDLDWAMFPTTYQKNILKYDLLDPAGHGQQNIFDSTLQVKLMQNPDFKEAFIERYAWYLNNVFVTERMLTIFDEMTELIRSEMPRQITRWGGPSSLSYWENQIRELRRITSEKRARVIVFLQETFNLSSSEMKALFPGDF
ncbi:MAG: CotH kinase family protein [Bacillota bacterium]|nr:CotH kinase family protein [Bacillota bacterium]